MRVCFLGGLALVAALSAAAGAAGEVITRLPVAGKVVALTFDACETKTPSHFDRSILDYLVRERIPCTLFVSGRFARRNREEIAELSRLGFIDVENHSLRHDLHMERLTPEEVQRDVCENGALLGGITGKPPALFRFPAGSFDARALAAVESLGYRVVHWSFASGDPDRKVDARELHRVVLSHVRDGSILIFHINGRGWHTGEALPGIVEELRRRGYRFARVRELLPCATTGASGEEGAPPS